MWYCKINYGSGYQALQCVSRYQYWADQSICQILFNVLLSPSTSAGWPRSHRCLLRSMQAEHRIRLYIKSSIPFSWLLPTEVLPVPCPTLILFHSSHFLPHLPPLCSLPTPPSGPSLHSFRAHYHQANSSPWKAVLLKKIYSVAYPFIHHFTFTTLRQVYSGSQNNHKYFM